MSCFRYHCCSHSALWSSLRYIRKLPCIVDGLKSFCLSLAVIMVNSMTFAIPRFICGRQICNPYSPFSYFVLKVKVVCWSILHNLGSGIYRFKGPTAVRRNYYIFLSFS